MCTLTRSILLLIPVVLLAAVWSIASGRGYVSCD